MAISEGKIVLNSSGTAWRPNLHIEDACQAIRCAIDLNYSGEKLLVLNVGDDKNNLKVLDIAKIIQNEISGCELKFLSDDPTLDSEGLIRDRKVKDGGTDTRTYRVSFQKIKEQMPKFSCKYDVQSGVRDLVVKFKRLNLTNEIFKSKRFYRLQQLENLHAEGFLSDDLFWLKERS